VKHLHDPEIALAGIGSKEKNTSVEKKAFWKHVLRRHGQVVVRVDHVSSKATTASIVTYPPVARVELNPQRARRAVKRGSFR
jgi:hypothetical protein